MANSSQSAQLRNELATLRREHRGAIDGAAYIGWTTESRAVHKKRADRIEHLISRLAALDKEAIGGTRKAPL